MKKSWKKNKKFVRNLNNFIKAISEGPEGV